MLRNKNNPQQLVYKITVVEKFDPLLGITASDHSVIFFLSDLSFQPKRLSGLAAQDRQRLQVVIMIKHKF